MKRIQLCCGLVLLLSGGRSLAQGPGDTSETDLNNEERMHSKLLTSLRKGEVAANPNDKAHMAAVDFAARKATYPFSWSRYHHAPSPTEKMPTTMETLYKAFDQDIDLLATRNKDKTKEYARLFELKVIEHAKEVLDLKPVVPLAQVNITRALARSAALAQPELADAFVEILNNPQYNDGVKYYALRGLRDLLSRAPNPTAFLASDRADKVGHALVDFIRRPVPISPITPPDEKEGFAVIRREAVRALAQLRDPGRTGKDRPALALLQVMTNSGLNPEARIDERMEAAIGLARMRPGADKDPDYQVGYVVQKIALFLGDFANYYSTEYKQNPRIPCKMLAVQLLEALEALKADAKNPTITGMIDPARQLLDAIALDQRADPTPVVTAAQAAKVPDKAFKSVSEPAPQPKKDKD